MVVTNLVVALMIVSNVNERVMAFKVNECYLEKHPDVTRWFPAEFPLKPEPMIRERSVTNFVYSAMIPTARFTVKCEAKDCWMTHTFTPGELLGQEIREFFCTCPRFYCDDHAWMGKVHNSNLMPTNGGDK